MVSEMVITAGISAADSKRTGSMPREVARCDPNSCFGSLLDCRVNSGFEPQLETEVERLDLLQEDDH